MFVASILLWINIFFAVLAIAVNADNGDDQQLLPASSSSSPSSPSSFVTECSKCSFCCTPYSYCSYFDKTTTYTCQPNTEADAAAYYKLVEEAKQYMITAPPGSQPTIAPRAVVNTRKPPHVNSTSGATMAMGKPDGFGGLFSATVVIAAIVGFVL